MDLQQSDATFPETLWTLLCAPSTPDDPSRGRALTRLVELYWPAVYAFLRRSGRSRDEAAELAQGFFADVVLSRSLLASATPERGRLRTLVIAALKNYLIDDHRRRSARGAGRIAPIEAADLDHEEGHIAARGDESPEAGFDRRWAAAIVDQALRRCEAHYRESGREAHWRLFEARLVRPALSPGEAPALARLAEDLGFRTAGDAAAAVQVVKKRFESLLREIVGETTPTGEESEDELRYVTACLR